MTPRSQTIASVLDNWWDQYCHRDIVLPTLALLFIEGLFNLGLVNLAVLGYLVAIVVLVGASYVVTQYQSVFIVLALLPLFRLINLGMPAFTTSMLYWLPLAYSAFLPGVYILYRPRRRDSDQIGRTQMLLYSVAAVVLGAVLAGIELTVTTVEVLLQNPTIIEGVLISFVMFMFISVVEELLFRGVIQQELQSRIGRVGGISITAALFGMMHATTLSGPTVLFGIGLGIVIGYVYDRTASLPIACLLHGSLNVFLYGIFPMFNIM